MTLLRNCSNGSLSRKKKDSFVAMASTIAVASGSEPARSCCTNSPSFDKPARRASGKSLLSTRYCLSAASTRPERSRNSLRK
jgi:hypothetical protein